ncbi:MAG: hypothetical protein EXS42_06925 [Lacunisphaera sp.]|nr:hypothetical protein [Lacunisphaera sp.]
MKLAGSSLLFYAVAGTLAAQSAEPVPPAKASARVVQGIRSAMPKYAPPHETKPAPAKPADRRIPTWSCCPHWSCRRNDHRATIPTCG